MNFWSIMKTAFAAIAGGATMGVAQYAQTPGAHLDSKVLIPIAVSGAATAIAYWLQSPNKSQNTTGEVK